MADNLKLNDFNREDQELLRAAKKAALEWVAIRVDEAPWVMAVGLTRNWLSTTEMIESWEGNLVALADIEGL